MCCHLSPALVCAWPPSCSLHFIFLILILLSLFFLQREGLAWLPSVFGITSACLSYWGLPVPFQREVHVSSKACLFSSAAVPPFELLLDLVFILSSFTQTILISSFLSPFRFQFVSCTSFIWLYLNILAIKLFYSRYRLVEGLPSILSYLPPLHYQAFFYASVDSASKHAEAFVLPPLPFVDTGMLCFVTSSVSALGVKPFSFVFYSLVYFHQLLFCFTLEIRNFFKKLNNYTFKSHQWLLH